MTYFDTLRHGAIWIPEFKKVDSIEAAAHYINIPYEDFPDRVNDTQMALNYVKNIMIMQGYEPAYSHHLEFLHEIVFGRDPKNESHAGKFRLGNVRVATHVAPDWSLVPKLMRELEWRYPILDTIELLKEWYTDFSTIHPFQDGNGRVSGIVVAAISHYLGINTDNNTDNACGKSTWLTPLGQ